MHVPSIVPQSAPVVIYDGGHACEMLALASSGHLAVALVVPRSSVGTSCPKLVVVAVDAQMVNATVETISMPTLGTAVVHRANIHFVHYRSAANTNAMLTLQTNGGECSLGMTSQRVYSVSPRGCAPYHAYATTTHVTVDVRLALGSSDDWVTAAVVVPTRPDRLLVGTRSSTLHVYRLGVDDAQLMSIAALFTCVVDDLPAAIKPFRVGVHHILQYPHE